MKSPVLVSVSEAAVEFGALFAAAAERRLRVGWLELDDAGAVPPELAPPLAAGAFRAVSVLPAATVSAKSRRGPAVLRDLLREHFLGADAVLVRGVDLLPKLRREGAEWWWTESAERSRRLDLEGLFERLRKPELRWRAAAGPARD